MFDEAAVINDTIGSLLELKSPHVAEIFVVDGNPAGSTVKQVTEPTVQCLVAPKGRARQMNAGAKKASGDILLFLHADTTLPHNGPDKIVETMKAGKYVAGAFNYAIQSRNLFIRHLYFTSALRSRISRIPYGDQAIFIRADYFHRLGGYPDIPIMEDIALMKLIKKNKDKIRILKEGVKTSTRRYEQEGILRRWLCNHKMRILYHFGVPAEKLLKYYPDVRGKT